MCDYYTYNAEAYCHQCLPVPPSTEGVGCAINEENDSPVHCCGCGELLPSLLTDAGIQYCLNRLDQYRLYGQGQAEVLDQWASELGDCSLDRDEDHVVDLYRAFRDGEKRWATLRAE